MSIPFFSGPEYPKIAQTALEELTVLPGPLARFRKKGPQEKRPARAVDQLEKCRSPDGCAPASCCVAGLVYVSMSDDVVDQVMR